MPGARHTDAPCPVGLSSKKGYIGESRDEMEDILHIEVVSAIQLPDVVRLRGFGVRMEPYCVIQSGNESVKTKKASGGGRSPNWHESVQLHLQPGDSDIAVQVFNYSKLGTDEEVARATLSLPIKYRQGYKEWEQRVAMQPVAKKGALWGGEVFLRLRYASPQECEERRQTWPGEQGPSNMAHSGQLNGESSHGSPTQARGADTAHMGSKLPQSLKSRATTDGAPQPLEASAPAASVGSSEAAENWGHSPKPAFSLHKALDKVLRKVGARPTTSHPVDVSVGTGADLSGHTSRRSSLGSMSLPEHASLPESIAGAVAPSTRHTLIPGWQEDGHTNLLMDGKPRISSATQTDSPLGQHGGELSSPNMSGLSGPALTLAGHSTGCQAQPMPANAQQTLHKEPSLAVSDCRDLYHSQQPSDASRAQDATPVAQTSPDQQGTMPAAAQAGALAIPNQGGRKPSQGCTGSLEPPASWSRPGMCAPASPFATDDDDDFTFSGSCTSGRGAARSELPNLSSESTQPGTSPGQDSLLALRQQESSSSQGAQQDSQLHLLLVDGAPGRARRTLESADSAYTAMHAERQRRQAEQLALRGGAAAAARVEVAPGAQRSAVCDQPQQQAPCDGCSDPMQEYSQGSSMAMSPVTGVPPKPQPSPFLQSEALSCGTDDSASPGKEAAPHMRAPRLRYRHSTGSGMQPLETSALQAGLQTMPHRIPPLPEMPPGEEGSGDEEAHGEECNCHADVSVAETPAVQECPAQKAESAEGKSGGRVVKKTLSRKSPYLPEVLPSLIKHEDILYSLEENGQPVCLGGGSFGQVYQAQYLECDVAVKKLNRVNDKASDEAFRKEAGILKGCRNPYIVNFMGVCKDEGGRICLVTELMDTSLMNALALPNDENKVYQYYAEGRNILICIIKALIYLHAYNIAHLDIKSANVLLKKGDAKVADVGLSQLLRSSFAASCSFGVGTFSWAATELLLGSHPVTTAADIFSFGVVLWEVCTLEQPNNRYMRTMEDHEAPAAIRKLFHDCLQEKPAARPTAKEVLRVLMQN